MKKLKKELILLSNFAIPPNEKSEKGLGDLLEFNSSKRITDLTNSFLEKNHNFLTIVSKHLNQDEVTYKIFVDNILKKEDNNDAKYFLEEFRVFAIKIYFSHPHIIKNLNFFESFKYNNIEKEKDNLILNTLNKNKENDFKK